MSLENRVEKLEQQTGVGIDCPVCDQPTIERESNYDKSIWRVGETLETEVDCVHCGRPRRIIVEMLQRRDEGSEGYERAT